MADTNYNLAASQMADGTIDFYQLLGEPTDADSETLRAKIQAIYGHASANRDHRNLNKRHEFQALLELLPAARTALLEDPKRARYDAYLSAAQSGQADTDFETFMNDLLGNNPSEEDRTSLLGVQEKSKPAEPRARVIKAPVPPVAAPAPKAAPSQRSATPFFGAVAGFIAGIVLGLILHQGIPIAFIIGLVLGAIGYFALNSISRGKIGT